MQRNVKLIAIKTIKRQTKLAGKRSIDLTEGAKLSGVRCTRMRTVSGCGSGERPECKGTAEGATRAGVRVAAPNLSGKRTEYGPITAQEHDACRKGETQNFLFCCRSFEPKSILPMGFGFLFAAEKKGNVKNDNGSTGRMGKQGQQRRMERPAAVSPRRYRHRVYHPHALCPAPQVRRRLEASVRPLFAQR